MCLQRKCDIFCGPNSTTWCNKWPGRVLEIGSGSGCHVEYFAPNFPHLGWTYNELINLKHVSMAPLAQHQFWTQEATMAAERVCSGRIWVCLEGAWNITIGWGWTWMNGVYRSILLWTLRWTTLVYYFSQALEVMMQIKWLCTPTPRLASLKVW